jgi:uncharacterized membrane protein
MELINVVLGTMTLRPYVFLFLLAYLWTAIRALGPARTLLFTALCWGVAFAAEASSIRTGIPFGWYRYLETTRGQELWLAGVPAMDSLSFTFLIYAGYALAGVLLRDPTSPGEPAHRPGRRVVLGAVLVVLLDVVIDPLAVRGDRWFLGKLFEYPEGGIYFGVPLSNFLGWAVVSGTALGLFTCLSQELPARGGRRQRAWRRWAGGSLLYAGVLVFNLAMTAAIGEWPLFLAGLLIHTPSAASLLLQVIPGDTARLRTDRPA